MWLKTQTCPSDPSPVQMIAPEVARESVPRSVRSVTA